MKKISQISNWEYAHQTPALPDDMVHIWCASLDLPPKDISQNHTLLSADEKRRAEKFFFIKNRNGFIAARGILRNILSRYLTVDPAAITFSYSPSGKPFLTVSSNLEGLSFNLSHSHRMTLYAVTLSRGVGVDLEEEHGFEVAGQDGENIGELAVPFSEFCEGGSPFFEVRFDLDLKTSTCGVC